MAKSVIDLHALGNFRKFEQIAGKCRPVLGLGSAVLIGIGLYMGLIASPPDYQQGETVRIMYIHVPAAYIATSAYAMMAIASAAFLLFRYPLAATSARCCAPIGAAFTVICLITGALWGKPTWGTWWVWDARLTSVLVLFFLYCGYIALDRAIAQQHNRDSILAILALIGALNLPIIKFSVDWWNTLHQPASLLRLQGLRLQTPTIHSTLLTPLLLMMAGFFCLFLWLLLHNIHNKHLATRVKILRRQLLEKDHDG